MLPPLVCLFPKPRATPMQSMNTHLRITRGATLVAAMVLTGVLADKDYADMFKPVLPLVSEFVCITPPNPRKRPEKPGALLE